MSYPARAPESATHDIFPEKIDARIGFRQPLPPCPIHQISKRQLRRQIAGTAVIASREDPADRENRIAVNQIPHRVADRQPRAHGGVIIQPVTPGFFKRVMNLAILYRWRRARQFIGANHMKTAAGEIKVLTASCSLAVTSSTNSSSYGCARIHRNSDSSSRSTVIIVPLAFRQRGWRPALHNSTGYGGYPPRPPAINSNQYARKSFVHGHKIVPANGSR